MAGPLGRVLVQLGVALTGVLVKSFAQAYQQAAAGGGKRAAQAAVRRGVMPVAQARQILHITEAEATPELVQSQFDKYFTANDPEKGGSYFLQCKIFHAKEALMEELGVHDDGADSSDEEAGEPGQIEAGEGKADKARKQEAERE